MGRKKQDLVLPTHKDAKESSWLPDGVTRRDNFSFRVIDDEYTGERNIYKDMSRDAQSIENHPNDLALATLLRDSRVTPSAIRARDDCAIWSARYDAGENVMRFESSWMGSGWRGSPTEFMGEPGYLEAPIESPNGLVFDQAAWERFASAMGGWSAGYNEETPATIVYNAREY